MYTIRPAAPNDVEEICRIRDEAWMEAYPNEALGITKEKVKVNAQGLHGEFIPRRVAWLKQQVANEKDDWAAYVGEVDGKVRGFLIVSVDEHGRKFLDNIYVKPGYQGKGLGKALTQQAFDWFGDEDDIYLEVVSYNQGAIRFYERLGFEKTNGEVPEEEGRPDFMTTIPQIEMVLRAKLS